MNSGPAPPWGRLALLAAAVTLVHFAMLDWQPQATLRPGPEAAGSFATRTIAAAAPQPQAAPERAEVPAPEPALAPDPAPAPALAPAAPVPTPPQPPAPTRARVATPPGTAADAPPAPARRPAPPATTKPTARPSPPAPQAGPAPVEATQAPAPIVPASATLAATPPAPPAPAPPAPAAPPVAVAVPPSARFHYKVVASWKGVPLHGTGTLDWRHDGQRYEARMEVSSLGRGRVQRSTGRITGQGLAPGYFSDKSRSEQAAHFDRERGRVIFSTNNPPAELEAGMQDRLSVVLQLSALIAGDPGRFPPGTDIALPTASTRETEGWVFEVEKEEDLQLPGGAVRALKLHRQPRKPYDQRVELWLAPRMDYAPVRVRLTNPNGDTVDQRWSSTDKG